MYFKTLYYTIIYYSILLYNIILYNIISELYHILFGCRVESLGTTPGRASFPCDRCRGVAFRPFPPSAPLAEKPQIFPKILFKKGRALNGRV